MTGMVFVFYCNWAVLLCLSVQAYENLALHQHAWQSSTRESYTGVSYTADLAVDGRYTGICADSAFYGLQTAEWRVDLGGVKNIHHVLIQHVDWYRGVFLGFSVYISNTTNKKDGVLCFRDTNFTTATIPNPVNITCPYHGRYVIYYNNRTHPPYPDDYNYYTDIGLCEVEVYDCPSPGFYGENCSLDCPQNCQNGYCDSVEGTCLACKRGFIGLRCDLECADGLFGNNCVENCSMTCGHPGVCHKVTDCPSPGFYGENCSLDCPQNCQNGYCDSVEGTCLACKRGFIGLRCDLECADGLFGNNCVENCSMTCGHPGVCHKVTGHCNGSCLAGWEGDMCEKECSIGLYGVNCLQNCSMACGLPGNCDRITGYCQGGCQRGWTGVRCEEGRRCINNISLINIHLSTYVVQVHIIVLIYDNSYI
ncbi:uncharacterized protein LOC111112904 [Crassostrea virginica]